MLMIKEPGLLIPAILSEKLQATFKHRHTKFAVPIELGADLLKRQESNNNTLMINRLN